MLRFSFRVPILLLIAAVAGSVVAAPPVDDTALLRRVADEVLRLTTRKLIDRSTGQTFTDSAALPLKPEISIESKFNAWFYQTDLPLFRGIKSHNFE
jgi:hypothetical protein